MSDNEYYEVTSGTNKYRTIVFEGEGMVRIHFGGITKCVFIDVYDEHYQAHLDAVGHKLECNLAGNLSRKRGTQDMIKAAITFTFKKFKSQTSISLKDVSNVSCNNGARVSLLHLYLALYGKSWYQKHFGFIPEVSEHVKLIRELNRQLRKPIVESFDDFFDRTVGKEKYKKGVKQIIKDTLKPIYVDAATHNRSYRDFIAQVKDNHDCVVFYKWLRSYVNSICKLPFGDMFWVLDKNRVPSSWHDICITRTNAFVFDMTGGEVYSSNTHLPFGQHSISSDLLT